MNRKNNRIKSQIVDILIQEFNDPMYWVREMDHEEIEDFGFSKEQESQIRKIIRSKLDQTIFMKLRLPIVTVYDRKDKNQPGIFVDLKINGSTLDVKWTIAPKFGNHSWLKLSGACANFEKYDLFFERLRLFLELNHKTGDFSRGRN